jgi:hypothetical protein
VECSLPFSSKFLPSHFLPINLKIKIRGTIILPIVLYGCEVWSLTLKEKHRLKVLRKQDAGDIICNGGRLEKTA